MAHDGLCRAAQVALELEHPEFAQLSVQVDAVHLSVPGLHEHPLVGQAAHAVAGVREVLEHVGDVEKVGVLAAKGVREARRVGVLLGA